MGPLALLAANTPPAENLSIFDPAAPPAESIRHLTVLVFAICAFILIVVEAVLIYSLVRFRRRGTPAPDAAEPPQVYGSRPIEIAWTAAPAMTVFVLMLVTARTLWEVKRDPPQPHTDDNTLFVTVVGRQWWWEYTYTHYNGKELRAEPGQQPVITANELHVPAGSNGVARPVYLKLESADVAHSFWVPRLAGKTDLIPGRTNSMWFQSSQPDLYLGQCAEYCGTQHAHMLLRVYVDPPDEFDAWLQNEARPPVDDPDRDARNGKEAFLRQSCVNCHRVRGTAARGNYAPDLTHLMARHTLAAGMVANTPDVLKRWVQDPQSIKSGCLMPAFGLSADDQKAIVDYLVTLK
jgi:cytochrome c oxidase subunit 2